MKAIIYDLDGKEKAKIDLPKCFEGKVREDIVLKYIEAKKTWQPYGPFALAGKQCSASGKLNHRRGVWKSQYKRGISRIPRKITLRRGSQFQWVGAFIPGTVGGRRAHPPKPIARVNTLKINKKEGKIAIISALTATTDKKMISKKYSSLEEKDVKTPIIVDSKIKELKTKKLLESLKKIMGEKMFDVAIKKKSVRAGKGKLRGRKYKKTAGMILVTGEKESIKTKAFDVQSVKELSVADLAEGGLGRIAVYTESAIKELDKKFDNKKEIAK